MKKLIGKSEVAVNKQIRLNSNIVKNIIKQRMLFIMLLPGVLFFLIFHYVPILGLVTAFKEYNPMQGLWESKWAGFKYFNSLFKYREFWQAVWNTLILGGLKIFFGQPISLVLALMLNEIRKSSIKRTIQSIVYLPHFFSWVVLGGLLIQLLSPSGGVVNIIIKTLGIDPIYFLADREWFRPTLIASTIWRGAGWGTIIFLASLTTIDKQLYEASEIDGAGRWRQTWHITLPLLMPVFIIVLIIRLGYILGMDSFEQVLVLLTPVVHEVGDVIDYYVYRHGILKGSFSFATAAGMFKALVSFILVFTTNYLSKKLSNTSLW